MGFELEKKRYAMNLETERLKLRNILASDKNFIVDLWTDPDVTEYLGGPREREQLTRDIEENLEDPFLEEYDLWPVIEKETNQPIGHCGLLMKEVEGKQEIEVVYVIDKSYWGKGYATEISKKLIDYAFCVKNLQRVIALIKPENKGSQSVAAKAGMHMEKEVVRQNGVRMLVYVVER